MKFAIIRSELKGDITITSSKSIALRYLFLSIFSEKNQKFIGSGLSEDIETCFNILKIIKPNSSINLLKIDNNIDCFFEIEIDKGINENLYKKENQPDFSFDCKDSAFCLRALCPIISYFPAKVSITGSKQLLSRPHSFIFDMIKQGSAKIYFNRKENNFIINGPILPSNYYLDTIISTQHVSGLLMTLPSLNGKSEIYLHNFHNSSYIDLTLDILKRANINIQKEIIKKNKKFIYEKYVIQGKSIIDFNTNKAISIESDWSSASFFMVMAALRGPIKFYNLNLNSRQPDVKILEVLKIAGTIINIYNIEDKIKLESIEQKDNYYKYLNNKAENNFFIEIQRNNLYSFEFDIEDCPDIFPIICVLAVFCEGTTKIYGIKRLKFKESDRIKSIYENFKNLGIDIEIRTNYVIINGSSKFFFENNKIDSSYILLDSFNDHRIFMALVVLASFFHKNIIIEDNESYKKSYPEFLQHYESIGGNYYTFK